MPSYPRTRTGRCPFGRIKTAAERSALYAGLANYQRFLGAGVGVGAAGRRPPAGGWRQVGRLP
jgi:hypothetical protein